MRQVDLNADLGEGGPNDAAILAVVSSANVACGVHAGSPETAAFLARECRRRGIAFGAHPSGPPGRRGDVGRGAIHGSPTLSRLWLFHQIGALSGVAMSMGIPLSHAKAHGALYHACACGGPYAKALLSVVRALVPGRTLFAPAGSLLARDSARRGVRAIPEGFADRRYRSDGSLVPRARAGAMLVDPAAAGRQAAALAKGVPFPCVRGEVRLAPVGTICVHADTPGALQIARAARRALRSSGFRIAPVAEAA